MVKKKTARKSVPAKYAKHPIHKHLYKHFPTFYEKPILPFLLLLAIVALIPLNAYARINYDGPVYCSCIQGSNSQYRCDDNPAIRHTCNKGTLCVFGKKVIPAYQNSLCAKPQCLKDTDCKNVPSDLKAHLKYGQCLLSNHTCVYSWAGSGVPPKNAR